MSVFTLLSRFMIASSRMSGDIITLYISLCNSFRMLSSVMDFRMRRHSILSQSAWFIYACLYDVLSLTVRADADLVFACDILNT